jgi:hypothetical protein
MPEALVRILGQFHVVDCREREDQPTLTHLLLECLKDADVLGLRRPAREGGAEQIPVIQVQVDDDRVAR